MLDDVARIRELDQSGALEVIAAQPQQLLHRFETNVPVIEGIDHIVVAGMGGSALAAEFIKCWLSDSLPVPMTIVRDYRLPNWVGEKTLVVASSYSGNTEETLASLKDAENRQAHIVVVSAGGKLAQQAQSQNYPLFAIPTGVQPRLAVLYGVKALANLLEQLGLMTGLAEELEVASGWMEPLVGAWEPELATGDNPAKLLAQNLQDKVPVIYAGPTLSFLAMKWKIDINENAKHVAFWNVFPELNHNEFIGWANPRSKPLRVVELKSNLDHPQVAKRLAVTNELLKGAMGSAEVIEAHGESHLQQMIWTFVLGTYVSVYLAVLNGVDPTPVALVEELKQRLA